MKQCLSSSQRARLACGLVLMLAGLSGQHAGAQGFLHAAGIYLADGTNRTVILRGLGLGGWLVPEGYMIGTSSFANSPTEFRNKVAALVGAPNADQFFAAYRRYFVQRADIDSLARWGFNSVRLPMHYALLITGAGGLCGTGFAMIDSLLAWCEADRLYLILDLHARLADRTWAISATTRDLPASGKANLRQWTAELWKTIARRYASEQWIGGYDLLNETTYSFPSGNKPLRDLLVQDHGQHPDRGPGII